MFDDHGGRTSVDVNLLRDKTLGPRIVPIVADEARTFGMANLFRQIGIYFPGSASPTSPRTPVPCCITAKPKDGELLEEGITEAGALSSPGFPRRGPAYSVHGVSLCFRSTSIIRSSASSGSAILDLGRGRPSSGRADSCSVPPPAARRWAGRGLQHQDGSEPPGGRDHPELQGLRPGVRRRAGGDRRRAACARCWSSSSDVFYYVTLMNENYAQPDAAGRRRTRDVLRGCYRFARRRRQARAARARCSAPARSSREVVKAAAAARARRRRRQPTCCSVTSWSELARDGVAVRAAWRAAASRRACAASSAAARPTRGPIVAATDYVRAVPEQHPRLPAGRPALPDAGLEARRLERPLVLDPGGEPAQRRQARRRRPSARS